jgi:hypothetical protein
MKKRLSKKAWAQLLGLIGILLALINFARMYHVWPF